MYDVPCQRSECTVDSSVSSNIVNIDPYCFCSCICVYFLSWHVDGGCWQTIFFSHYSLPQNTHLFISAIPCAWCNQQHKLCTRVLIILSSSAIWWAANIVVHTHHIVSQILVHTCTRNPTPFSLECRPTKGLDDVCMRYKLDHIILI